MTTIHELAQEAAEHFGTSRCRQGNRRARGNDEEAITVLKDGAPEWVRDLVREAHDEMLPDDWRYASIRSALEAIADGEGYDPDEIAGEWADSNVDVYTGSRLEWLASNLNRPAYCDEGADELGGEGLDTVERIGLGQHIESREIFASIVQSLEDRLEVIEDEQTTCAMCDADLGGTSEEMGGLCQSCNDDEGYWAVGVTKTCKVLSVFSSQDEAAEYISTLPDHEQGIYYIDGPCNDDEGEDD